MKKILFLCLCTCMALRAGAQHFYYRLDVGTNNVYTFAAANLATAGLNALTNTMLFDNAYTYTLLQPEKGSTGLRTKSQDVVGLSARELFSDITAGGKLGYVSTFPKMFNWGIFASAHFRANQFKAVMEEEDNLFHQNIQRLQLGGGILITLGSVEYSTKVVLEAGLRYEIPLRYKGFEGVRGSDILNSGFSSHYAIRVNGNGKLQGLGIYADIPHYGLFKKDSPLVLAGAQLKTYTFGIIYTITPWKVKQLYY